MSTREKLYEEILEEDNQLVLIREADSLKILYANRAARAYAGDEEKDYRGKTCREYIEDHDNRCPFCPVWSGNSKKELVRKVRGGKQVFGVRIIRMPWDKKEVLAEYARDITISNLAIESFENELRKNLEQKNEQVYYLNLIQDRWLDMTGVEGNLVHLRGQKNIKALTDRMSECITEEALREKFCADFEKDALIKYYEKGYGEKEMEMLTRYEDGGVRWTRIRVKLLRHPLTGDLNGLLLRKDISEEKRYQNRGKKDAGGKEQPDDKNSKDLLTGLYSRQIFIKMSEEYLSQNPDAETAVVFLDLDNFTSVNESMGHLVGDKVIMNVADRLQTLFANKDVVARFDGDEFCILLKEIPYDVVLDKLDFLRKHLQLSCSNDGKLVKITASMGAVFGRGAGSNMAQMMEYAKKALQRAKRNGRDCYCIDRLVTERRTKETLPKEDDFAFFEL